MSFLFSGGLFDVIPDSGDLHARYDFSEEDGSLPITDQTGNGHELGTGSYTGVSESINGVQAGDFDGIDDGVKGTFTAEMQPLSIFVAYRMNALQSGQNNAARLFDGGSSTELLYQVDGSPSRLMYAGVNLVDSNANTNAHVFGGIYNGSSSALRIDGTARVTGDVGPNSLSGVAIGDQALLDGENAANMAFGEMLIYYGDKSSNASDIEQYLANKWGITN